jgi:hypothetical protein
VDDRHCAKIFGTNGAFLSLVRDDERRFKLFPEWGESAGVEMDIG